MKMEKLKKLRITNSLSCQDMAYFLNVSKTFYWQIESGERRLSYLMAVKIANIFKMKPDEIFYEDYKSMLFNT